MDSQPWSCKTRCPSPYLYTNKRGDHIYSFRMSKSRSLILYFSCCYFIVCVKVVHTLICPFWQGSEQTDWMTSLLLCQISRSFICRPPWSQLPTWMYAYSSSPMSLKFMISYLRVKEHAFTPQQPPSLPPWTTFPSPARRISVLVEVNGLPRYAGEVRLHEELQQFASVDGTHCLTQTLPSHKKVFCTRAASPHKHTPMFYLVSWTEGLLHGM